MLHSAHSSIVLPHTSMGDPGGLGRFCKMAIFFLRAVARPGFSLLVCEMAFRLKSVHHIRHLGSTILSRLTFKKSCAFSIHQNTQEVLAMAREVWAGVMFHILFSVLSTILVDGVYLELSKTRVPHKRSTTHFMEVTWPQIYLDESITFPEIRQKIFLY